ncbi:uncharacterized protein LOC123405735 [Hordeum vulgare subsp. vulgare]|uniref:Uncharacterized protein n=1 Tax=Hordeum vulgare subsp. vulgare TaxID=112509 RepID=A0A8I6YFN1_HORVV|nr:uncharacterized protein LOC123405735 [Hordeum vulgare subsp. vulgare]
MDGNKTAAAHPASVRALSMAAGTVVVFALATAADYVLDSFHLCGSQASFILPCVGVTAAAAAKWRALWLAMVCCAVLESAVAAQALRLPCRRRALALLQLALTVVRHYMYARATLILAAADPGLFGICFGSVSVFVTGDLLSFMDLLLGGEGIMHYSFV